MGIQRLPSAVVSSLRTDVTITTTAQCVIELVLNSVDAGATAVAVRIDLKNFRIQVVDNGCGFAYPDLKLVGARYMTSKCHSLKDLTCNLGQFGFRGEALSSISEICGTLSIVSRCQDSENTYCKVFTQGIAHNVSKSHQPRASCGTTITVADFLYNRPVRRARIKPALDLEDVKSQMESVALINPHVSFSLRNDVTNDIIIQTHRTRDITSVFGTLFGNSIAKTLMPVREDSGSFRIEGYISSEAHLLKNLQFIYVNKRLLLKTKLHKLVNSLMSRRAILKSNNVPQAPISKEINHSVFLAFSPPKRSKHAIFLFNITCPLSEYDITLDPKKTLVEFSDWDCLLSCFESLLRKFIDREAGIDDAKEKGFDSEPPKKMRSVIDEINQLSREEALGADMGEQSKKSISTRDLSRAVHSMPASRHQVNLSPDLSTVCMPSTASSNLVSSVLDSQGRGTVDSSCSVFTEKPYPPFIDEDLFKRKRSAHPFLDTDSCTTGTEKLPAPKETSRQKDRVEEPRSLFKKPQIPVATGKKPVKGFLSIPIHFQDNFRKIPDLPLVGKSDGETTVPSPINALASIKEIRRKKLLNNLNKFSFKVACGKPVLNKTQCPARSTNNLKTDRGALQNPGKIPTLNLQKASEKTKESKAVQTTLTPATSFESDMMCSQKATCDSRSVRGSSTICSSQKLQDSENLNKQGLRTRDANELKTSVDSKAFDLVRLKDVSNSSDKKELLDECMDLKYRNIFSPEDMIFNWFDVRNKPPSSPGTSAASKAGVGTSSLCTVTGDTVFMEPSQSKSSCSLVQQTSDKENVHDDSQFSDLHLPGVLLASAPVLESRQSTTDMSPMDVIDPLPGESSYEKISDSSGFNPVKNNKQDQMNIKLVDYDSSPSSSQEFSSNEEGESSCPGKRKSVNDQEHYLKKICLLPEQCSGTKVLKLTGIPHEVDLSFENSKWEDTTLRPVVEENQNTFTFDDIENSTNVPVQSENDSQIDDQNEMVPLNFSDSILEQDCMDQEQQSESHLGLEISKDCSDSNHQLSFGLENDENNWAKEFDDCGKLFFVHKKTGLTTYLKPHSEENRQFKFSERFSFLPKGMSPILMDKVTNEPSTSPSTIHFKLEDSSAIKWGREQDGNSDFWPLVDQLLTEADKFSTNFSSESQVSNATVQELSQSDIKTYNAMCPFTFSKEIFHKLRVLGQLDKKFIVTIVTMESNKEVIVLFDQHAVHERIRVESLTEEYKQHDGAATWRSAPVEPTLPLPLSSIEVRILDNYKEKMERLGLSFTVVDCNTIRVQRVPTCLLLRENREVTSRGVSVLRQHLENLIREQVDSLLSTRGVGTDHPTIIQNVISSEACRGAVKFGHPLTVEDCQAYLHNLSSCKLPFQCAHGRPALVPIVDLSMLKQRPPRSKPKLWKLKRSV